MPLQSITTRESLVTGSAVERFLRNVLQSMAPNKHFFAELLMAHRAHFCAITALQNPEPPSIKAVLVQLVLF